MKLIRFHRVGGDAGAIAAGFEQSSGRRIDFSGFGEDYGEHFFGTDGPERLRKWLRDHEDRCPEVAADARLAPPCARPSKLICVGLNYAAHARKSGAEPPEEPVIFMKATSAICGPYDDIVLPRGSEKTDWEVELAIVVGRRASYVDEAEAMGHVAGYVLHNDVSERAYQLERGRPVDQGQGLRYLRAPGALHRHR